ncbi:Clan SB, family S8, subtilisin-like serine peptidase [Tritrichomonas foetus]|uniref:Clan SB, family S8, subtilisin-like serine peptidase n=1 Tax=Tritrichomonas foetus TaxID=1144522 RepID=A0A1J4KCG8_9EUKA|nr:Clan SB, family S8, subtilisin-like serine peptidase [Tritrichomonas foetus]|eukprot:OHT08632.1 Clan SB, family S8, subtilisin-like serine peptidase [Tritrichomonas foetus]
MILLFFFFNSIFSIPNDPEIQNSYALHNNGIFGSPFGEDINIFPVWERNHSGNGTTIAIIGNGVYTSTPDLVNQQLSELHFNLDDDSQNVEPSFGDQHAERSTGMTGIVVAEANNGFCSAGVAYNSNYFFFKTTDDENKDSKILKALQKNNDNATIKYFSISPTCQAYDSSLISICPQPNHSPEIEETISEMSPIVVTSAGNDAVSGGDSNFFAISRSKDSVTISDTTAGGMRPFWSNRGSSIIANAPAGGSTGILSASKYDPSPPTPTREKCSDLVSGVISNGAGAAYATGVIALMKEINPELKARDIHAIFAITSTINDPFHQSWTLNGAGFNYSDIYGFGRINADLAVNLAQNWNDLPERQTQQINFETIELNESRSGFKSVASKFNRNNQKNIENKNENNNINFIEFIELEFQCEDIGMLTLFVTSPMGTKLKVVAPASLKLSGNNEAYYVVRGFFGEDPHGQWNITVTREGFGNKIKLENILIKISGTTEKIDLPKIERKIGSDPSKSLPNQIKLELSEKQLVCDKEFTVSLKANEQELYALFLKDEKHHSMFQIATGIELGQEISVKIPCLFNSKTEYKIYAENRRLNVSDETSVNVSNDNADNIILKPTPYDTIYINNGQITIDLKVALHNEYLLTDSIAQSAIVGLFDFTKKQDIFRRPILVSEFHSITIPIEQPIQQAVLYVVPLFYTNTSGCSTMIQPVFIIGQHDDEPEKFELPLNDEFCPIPEGINDGDFTHADPKLRWIWIGSICGFTVLFMMMVMVWHFTCRRRKTQTTAEKAALLITEGS